jgi:hypothetical protein
VADKIKGALAEARTKLGNLMVERKRIDHEIIEWKCVVDSLSAVSEEESEETPPDLEITASCHYTLDPTIRSSHSTRIKFTDAVREILRLQHPRVLRVPLIRDYLIEWTYDFSKYKQELVPVHNALKRLEEQGEAKAIKDKRGRLIGYQWIEPFERALRNNDLTDIARQLVFGEKRKATRNVASQKGQAKTDDSAPTEAE